MNIHPIWDAYPEIKKDLTDVLKVIDDNITLKDANARKTILDLLHSGGKLLRPAFFILFAQTGKNYDREKMIHIAASIEVLHMATLIHDDIIDEAETRRGLPTVVSQYGTKYALYTGDYLFCVCFRILSKYATELATIQFKTHTVEKVLIGELDQMHSRYNYLMTVKNYLNQINRKTAALFSLSTAMGAQLSSTTKREQLEAKRAGNEIGMAFQILDDILDYTQTADEIGKPVLEDMKQGVYSLPLIYTMRKKPSEIIPVLQKKEGMTDEDIQFILRKVKEERGVEEAHHLAMKYSEKAMRRLAKLPESSAKKIMMELTKKLLSRTN